MKGLWVCLVLLAGSIAEAQPVRQMLSGLRQEKGLGPLVPSPLLEETAKVHALDMARNGFFSHAGSDGSTVMDRARTQGYRACAIVENIAKGQRSVTEVLGAWIESPPHRRNILMPELREYGLVRAPGNIWVLVLGKAGC